LSKKYIAVAGIVLFLFTCLVLPFVSAEFNNVEECTSSDFELKIGQYLFSFEFSKSNEQPSLKYLICKYKERIE